MKTTLQLAGLKTGQLLISFLLLALILGGCTSIPVEQRDDKRAELVRVADTSVAELIEQDPDIQQIMDESVGYFVSEISQATVALIGGAQGIGVLTDLRNGDRTYLNVKRFDLGAGLGVRYFRVVIFVQDPELFEQMRGGRKFQAVGADLAAGSTGTASAFARREGYSVHFLSDSGASLSATARLVNLAVNRDLTDTGVSMVSFPNIGLNIEDGREENEKRWWDHKMPFMAQKVIDMGYDLPLPYGLKGVYVSVDQEQLLDNLYVGIDGTADIPIEFVDLLNARSISDSAQFVYDTWLFPFMNVFAVLGTVDGNAPVDVLVNGNGFLDALGIDCSKPGNVVPCRILEDQEYLLPINAKFQGNTYGLGFNLATGWRQFFFTVPFSWVYADMKNSETDGAVLSASPRVGYLVKMGRAGNLGIYAGGSYLDSDLTVVGRAYVPGTDFGIDYKIDQQNKDKWAGILGANWDINGRWAIQAEYNGFFGSRESWMGSVTWRF